MARRSKKKEAKTTNRYQDEIHAAIMAEVEANGDVLSTGTLRDKLLASLDDKLITNWLWEQAPTLLATEITAMLRHQRGRIRQQAKSAAFGDAVKQAQKGEATEEQMSVFQTRYFLGGGDGTSYSLGSLRGSDHHILADNYSKRGNKFLLYGELHTQIARRCGNKRTDEVFTEDELLKLMGNFEYDVDTAASKSRAA